MLAGGATTGFVPPSQCALGGALEFRRPAGADRSGDWDPVVAPPANIHQAFGLENRNKTKVQYPTLSSGANLVVHETITAE